MPTAAEELAKYTAQNMLESYAQNNGFTSHLADYAKQINGVVSPEMYGAIGDGVTDDTVAVQAAFDSGKNVIFYNDYAVTHVETTIGLKKYDFNGHTLIGIAVNEQDSVLTIRTMYCTYRDIAVLCNCKDNYYCAVQMVSTVEQQTQYNLIFGMFLKEAIYGLVWGAKEGETSIQQAQSETYIYGFRTRSVMIPFLGNQDNGYLTFNGATFDNVGYEWIGKTSSRYNDDDAICVKNIVGDVVISDSELVCPDNVNKIGIYGRQIFINNTIFECAGTQAYIIGNMRINGVINGYIGSGIKTLFVVGAGSKGQFTLTNAYFHHPTGTGSSISSPLLYADSCPEFDAVIDNVKIDESMVAENVFGNAKVNVRNLKYPTTGRNINIGQEFNVCNVDSQCNDVTTTAQSASFLNWIINSSNGTLKRIDVSSSYGNNVNGGEYVGGASGWTECKTKNFSVVPNRYYLINVAGITSGSGVGVMLVDWYDSTNTLITSIQLIVFTNSFINYNIFKQAPDNACYASLRFSTNGGNTIKFTDLYMCGEKANWA